MRRSAFGLGTLLTVSALLAALVPGVSAGSQAAPEIDDAVGDWAVMGLPLGTVIPANVVGQPDIDLAWIEEDGTNLFFRIQAASDITGIGIAGPAQVANFDYAFSFNVGSTALTATAHVTGGLGGGVTAGGAATAATVSGAVLNLTVPKTALPASAIGTVVSSLAVTAEGVLLTSPLVSETDTASSSATYELKKLPAPTGFPDGAPGCVYKTGETNKTDNDADCLPDYWEKQYFTNTTAQNATMDPDADGASNYSEYIAGTDPTKKEAATTCTYKSGETNTTDTDGDCLPDYWEKQHFTTVTAQNATGDPDKDACNNRCEYLRGSDPNKSDLTTSTATSTTGTGTGTNTGTQAACTFRADEANKTDADKDCLPDAWEKEHFTNTTAQNGGGDPDGDGCDNQCEYLGGSDPNVADQAGNGPLDKLTANLDYLAQSAGAGIAVIGIAIVALVRRWAL